MSYIIKSEDKTRLHEIGEPLHGLEEETFFFFFPNSGHAKPPCQPSSNTQGYACRQNLSSYN